MKLIISPGVVIHYSDNIYSGDKVWFSPYFVASKEELKDLFFEKYQMRYTRIKELIWPLYLKDGVFEYEPKDGEILPRYGYY